MAEVIKADDFINTLSRRGLVIVSASEFEKVVLDKKLSLREKQQACLKKKALTFKEIIDAEFFDVKSKNTLKQWVVNGRIAEAEHFISETDGKHYVLTIAVLRLLRNQGIEL